ncbi:hypothetical protein ACE01N_14645 [Saccharicrinis sp. FJH2]|uniref:hypothetical protein n=1 Tax=Saccharicrinis sp. FJH65 TaxID=3344659 RepID=UPI0035F336F7
MKKILIILFIPFILVLLGSYFLKTRAVNKYDIELALNINPDSSRVEEFILKHKIEFTGSGNSVSHSEKINTEDGNYVRASKISFEESKKSVLDLYKLGIFERITYPEELNHIAKHSFYNYYINFSGLDINGDIYNTYTDYLNAAFGFSTVPVKKMTNVYIIKIINISDTSVNENFIKVSGNRSKDQYMNYYSGPDKITLSGRGLNCSELSESIENLLEMPVLFEGSDSVFFDINLTFNTKDVDDDFIIKFINQFGISLEKQKRLVDYIEIRKNPEQSESLI